MPRAAIAAAGAQPVTDSHLRHSTSQMEQPAGTFKIELSPTQVRDIVRRAVARGTLSVLFARLTISPDALEQAGSELADSEPTLSTSLIRGLLVLAQFPLDGNFISVSEVAERLDLGVSTTHRYVQTLVVAGLLERDAISRRYRVPR